MIEVDKLTKKYGNSIVVDQISFKVTEGEIFSLLGPNGAGKTTTIEILEGLKKPTSGEVKVLEYDISKNTNKIKKQIGVMPQNFNAFERLTARENIQLIGEIYGNCDSLEEILKLTGVKEFESKHYLNLSGGMKTKVGIGMALISKAPLLFLDEPTTGLDPKARREVWSMIEQLKDLKKTIILTSHYMEEVEKLSDRVAIMIDGQIKSKGNINSLIKDHGGNMQIVSPKTSETENILNQKALKVFDSPNEDNTITGIFYNNKDAKKAIIELYKQDYDIKIKEPNLEEAFINLSGSKINEEGELVS